jgi:ribosome-associated protein
LPTALSGADICARIETYCIVSRSYLLLGQRAINKEDCLDSNQLARRIVEIVEGKQGTDILMLNVSEQTTIATYFVIATVDNERQANAIREDLWEQLRVQEKIRPLNTGQSTERTGGWILLDYGDVILHLFTEEARSYYNLEELWQEASVIVRML